MQYIPCNSAFLAQETMFLTKKKLSFYHFSFSTKFLLFSIILYYSPLIFFSISTMFLIIVHHFFSPSPPNFCLLKISDQYEISQTFLGQFVLASSLVISHYLLQTGPSRFTRQAKSVYNNTNSFAQEKLAQKRIKNVIILEVQGALRAPTSSLRPFGPP